MCILKRKQSLPVCDLYTPLVCHKKTYVFRGLKLNKSIFNNGTSNTFNNSDSINSNNTTTIRVFDLDYLHNINYHRVQLFVLLWPFCVLYVMNTIMMWISDVAFSYYAQSSLHHLHRRDIHDMKCQCLNSSLNLPLLSCLWAAFNIQIFSISTM